MVRDWQGLPRMGQELMRKCGALSERGPKAPKGSKGLRQIYVQGFAEQVQVYGAEEQEGKSCCKVDIKSKATLQNCGSYIGTGEG